MKWNKRLRAVIAILLTIFLGACAQSGGQEQAAASQEEALASRCREISGVYYGAWESLGGDGETELGQERIDQLEELLLEADLDVLDTDSVYPAYASHGERFRQFWELVQQGENARQELIRLTQTGELAYTLFEHEDGQTYCTYAQFSLENDCLTLCEKHEVLDWTLTERGHLYYQIYPAGDKHYADYLLLRLEEPDRDLYDLTLRCILPVGYTATNLFLIDWTESDFGQLSLNDLWDHLYYANYAEQFDPGGNVYHEDECYYEIPAAEFEALIFPYFDMELEQFRAMALYDGQGEYYPWRPVASNDFVWLSYYAIEPEVTACRSNPDGTLTLTVEVLSTDLKLDCLFAHEVTIRPLADGGFQYAGNTVTYQREYGLPYCKPRLTWADPGK